MNLVSEACSRLRLGPYRLERVASPPALTYGPRLNEPRFEACSSFDGLKRKKKKSKKKIVEKKFSEKKFSKIFLSPKKKFSTKKIFFVQNVLKRRHKHFHNI